MNAPILCDDLDAAVDEYTTKLGYRLDMIFPADAPREAVLSVPSAVADGLLLATTISVERKQIRLVQSIANVQSPTTAGGTDPETSDSEWITGRAGMEYRDLIPDRLGRKVIASHIRLSKGGEVDDYVHYHKVDFQMIYCKRGRIRVVYEDQGPPFWLETDDCVLQPPEIRHRVLECTAGAEVIEVSMPAEHETWVEHEIELPTAEIKPDRDFGGQRFVRSIAKDSTWIPIETTGSEVRDIGIAAATNRLADVRLTRSLPSLSSTDERVQIHWSELLFLFSLCGNVTIRTHVGDEYKLSAGENCIIPLGLDFRIEYSKEAELLEVSIGKR